MSNACEREREGECSVAGNFVSMLPSIKPICLLYFSFYVIAPALFSQEFLRWFEYRREHK